MEFRTQFRTLFRMVRNLAWGVRKWHSCARSGFRTVRKFSHLEQWCAKMAFKEFRTLKSVFAPWDKFRTLFLRCAKMAPFGPRISHLEIRCAKFSHLEIRCAKFSHLEMQCSVSLVFLPCFASEEFSTFFLIFFWNLSSKLTWIKTT